MALKILLADDSMTAQNMGKKILTEAGYDIIAVSNGAAATSATGTAQSGTVATVVREGGGIWIVAE